MEATKVPIEPCSLLVAIAMPGGMPVSSSAGTVIKPPPPASVSTQPAVAAIIKSNNNSSVLGIIGVLT